MTSRIMVRVRTIAAALILTHIVCAQSSWRPMPDTQPAGRRAHAAAYDEARERLVLFGGLTPQVTFAQNDTWEWDGTSWHAMVSPQSPTQRYYAAMTYDADRGRSVLFGGIESNTIKGDTWEWDGTQWSEVSATTAPPPRSSATLVYDSTRKRVVMYGGNLRFGSSSPLSDLWEFDGTDWVQRSFSNGPGPMSGHIAAYDEHRQRMVVYSSKDHELWEWDGTAWALADPNPAFPKRSGASLAYDRNRKRCILYGGAVGLSLNPPMQDTWEWDGTSWTQMMTPTSAGPRSEARSVFDSSRGQVLVVGGRARMFNEFTSAISGFDGKSWRTLTPPHNFVNMSSGVAWDGNSGRPIAFGGGVGLFGGSQQTYTFDGEKWVLMPVADKPAPRSKHTLQWDRARQEVVMFGGTIGSQTNETWVWDGANWQQRHPASSPSPRDFPAMTYDERRERVVLYGGSGFLFAPPFGDTWIWDGADWREITTTNSPPPLQNSALAYDDRRDRCVLFGGGTGGAGLQTLGETWEFDGSNWAEITPEHSPSPRTKHTMVYDPVRERVVLFGGQSPGTSTDTWEWDGQDWIEVPHDRPPYFVRMVFDERRVRSLGFADGSESWEYRSDNPPALTGYGSGCGQATLSVAPLHYPVVGRPLTLTVSPARRFWPVLFQIGFSAPAPIPLDALGMPGCTLLQSAELWVFAFADRHGTAALRIPAFSWPWMLGASFHAQGIAREPRTTPLGWVTTQGVTLQFGR